MRNVEMKMDGSKLIITVDTAQTFKLGKTIIIASTEGNVSAPGAEEIKVGLNVYKSRY